MTKDNKNDLGFVNPLYACVSEEPKFKVDILLLSIVTLVLGLIFWANIAKIDEITKSDGKVIPSTNIQKVQNLDGGIVSEILVRNGQNVKKDEALMKIDTTRFKATLEETKEEELILLSKKARLETQLKFNPAKKMPKIKFPKILKSTKKYTSIERKIYENNIQEYKSSLKILELQLRQKIQESKEIKSKIKQLSGRKLLVNKELKTITKMTKQGVKSSMDLLNIQKEANQLAGDIKSAELSLPRSKLAIKESKSKIVERVKKFKSESYKEIQKVIALLNKIDARMVSDTDKLEKTIVRSPVDGIIKQININTIGEVVKSGVDLIEIVPNSDILLIEAKINPKDIAFISPTQVAKVKLSAYDYAIYGGLEGKIMEISADSIVDKNSKENKSYYKIIVKTNKNYLERNGEKLPIIPGMVATVDIVTGKKSIMDFFLKPIIKIKEESLHER